jgi:hypothetical protein
MVLILGHFGKQIRNTWKVLKCGSEKGWRSGGPIVLEMKTYYIESRRRRIYHK